VFDLTGQEIELMVGSLKMNTTLEYSTRVVQEGDRRCKKSTLNDLAYLTPLRIPLMNPVLIYFLPYISLTKYKHFLKPYARNPFEDICSMHM
jgi:hypothetical protein